MCQIRIVKWFRGIPHRPWQNIDLPACQSHDDAVRRVRIGAARARVFRPRGSPGSSAAGCSRTAPAAPRQLPALDGHRRVSASNLKPIRAGVRTLWASRLARDVAVLREDVLSTSCIVPCPGCKALRRSAYFRRILRQLENVFRQAPGAVLIREYSSSPSSAVMV